MQRRDGEKVKGDGEKCKMKKMDTRRMLQASVRSERGGHNNNR